MNRTPVVTEAFVLALGVTIRPTEPDGCVAAYDKYNRIAYVSADLDATERERVMDALLRAIS